MVSIVQDTAQKKSVAWDMYKTVKSMIAIERLGSTGLYYNG
jgi:hypothetical protein